MITATGVVLLAVGSCSSSTADGTSPPNTPTSTPAHTRGPGDVGETSLTDLVIYPSGEDADGVRAAVTRLGGRIVTSGLDTYLARWPQGTTLAELTSYRDQLRKVGLTVETTVVFPTTAP